MSRVAQLAAGTLALSLVVAFGPVPHNARAWASGRTSRTIAPGAAADLPSGLSVSYTADTTTSFSCDGGWLTNPGCQAPNWAAKLAAGPTTVSYSEQAQGSLASTIPIDDQGQGSAPLTESEISVTGSGTWNETDPDCVIAATSGAVSTGASDPGTMQLTLAPVTDSSGTVTDFSLAVSTPTEPDELENWSWNQTASGPGVGTDPTCIPATLSNPNEPEYNAINDIYALATYDSFPTTTSADFVLTGWSINPAWTEASGGVWATKTISQTIPYNYLQDPTIADQGTIQVSETVTIATKAANLVITSPPPNSTIAVTDGNYVTPQPGPDGRAPASRSLIVRGTSQCPAVMVNNVAAQMTGSAWQVQLPITSTGPVNLDASAPGCDDATESLTLINLDITSPTENAVLPVSVAPAMPALNATVRVDGYPGSTSRLAFTWALNMRGEEADSSGWHQYQQTVAKTTMTGTGPWRPKYAAILGGWGQLTVQATVPGALDNPVTSDPRWINVPGTNPMKTAVENYIGSGAGKLSNDVKHLVCQASSFRQFSPTADPQEPPSANIPPDMTPNPAPLRPLLATPPAGIGIAQRNPAAFPSQQWNWKANVLAGIQAYQAAHTAALGSRAAAQSALDRQRTALLAKVNAQRRKRKLSPVSVKRIIVPAMTATQIERDALRRYKDGPEYHFDARYVAGRNLTVRIAGSRQWAVIPNLPDPSYVTEVLACQI